MIFFPEDSKLEGIDKYNAPDLKVLSDELNSHASP